MESGTGAGHTTPLTPVWGDWLDSSPDDVDADLESEIVYSDMGDIPFA